MYGVSLRNCCLLDLPPPTAGCGCGGPAVVAALVVVVVLLGGNLCTRVGVGDAGSFVLGFSFSFSFGCRDLTSDGFGRWWWCWRCAFFRRDLISLYRRRWLLGRAMA